MQNTSAGWLLVSVAWSAALALSCSGGSDSGPATGGASNGGSTSAASGASAGGSSGARAGASNGGGTTGQAVDCAAVCGHVKTLCASNGSIDDLWLSACKSACDARVQLTPDTAELEQTCVTTAADCSAAIVCVASPH